MPCAACGIRQGIDAHHVRTRGSGGGDELSNLISLCRVHHTEVHILGLTLMCKKYAGVGIFLENLRNIKLKDE